MSRQAKKSDDPSAVSPTPRKSAGRDGREGDTSGPSEKNSARPSASPPDQYLDSAPLPSTGRRFREPARLVGAQANIRTRLPVILLTGLSLLLLCLIFPPVAWWWLAYVSLVPWLFCVCTAARARLVYLMSFCFGLGFYLISIRWMIPVTPPGYLALCFGFSLFFPLAAWPIRHMYRRHGVSVALTAPIAWVAIEYLRSIGPLGFPFLLLGHSHYQVVNVIQISDLVGAYGVSFVLAMVNGWLTDLLIQPILIWRTERATRLPVGSLTTLLVVLATLIYGSAQRSSDYFEAGPKVAVIQHDFPMYVDERAGRTGPRTVFQAYLAIARKAAEQKPDLIVLPETAMSCYINDEFLDAAPAYLDSVREHRFPKWTKANLESYRQFSREVRDGFQELSTTSGIPIIVGSSSLEWKPTEIPPRVEAFNSAFLLEPGKERPVARYDKIHLVLFGEYVPFRYSFRSLYDRLNAMTPWGREGVEYSLSEGKEYTVFEFNAASRKDRRYRAAVPICYEEIMPYITRAFVRGQGEPRGKNIDMLLTISNDGWFLHSAELEQHLAAAVFRAVENRIPVARSVNTGASAQIHPNGKIHDLAVLAAPDAKLLEPLAEALRKLYVLAERLEDRCNEDEGYRKAFVEVAKVYQEEYRQAFDSLGPEYRFFRERLDDLLIGLTAGTAELRSTSAATFVDQIREDLSTIARWHERPWTAPGFIIAEMKCDDRVTIYSRSGDWFAQGAVGLLGVMLLDWLLRRVWRRKPAGEQAMEGERL